MVSKQNRFLTDFIQAPYIKVFDYINIEEPGVLEGASVRPGFLALGELAQ